MHSTVAKKCGTSILQNVDASSVKLVVRDNIMLRPGHDVYIMVNTTIRYTVVRLRQGKATGWYEFFNKYYSDNISDFYCSFSFWRYSRLLKVLITWKILWNKKYAPSKTSQNGIYRILIVYFLPKILRFSCYAKQVVFRALVKKAISLLFLEKNQSNLVK